jgi:phosphatidylserine/phosphatidylglycerophosphate/cardiolipin synthase-like enzyme
MITQSNNDYIYIGKEAGKEILHEIRHAKKSVKIVSPYLSPDYVKELIKLHREGKQVTLITCDKIGETAYSDFKISDLIEKKEIHDNKASKLKKRLLKSSMWLGIAALIFGISAFFFTPLFVFAGVLMLASFISLISFSFISGYTYKYDPIFRIKVFDSTSGEKPWSTELIHSKIFVIDEGVAFLGSVNFTYSGFKKHYETVIRVEDKGAVADISEEVEKLYASDDLREKGVEEWGVGV